MLLRGFGKQLSTSTVEREINHTPNSQFSTQLPFEKTKMKFLNIIFSKLNRKIKLKQKFVVISSECAISIELHQIFYKQGLGVLKWYYHLARYIVSQSFQ